VSLATTADLVAAAAADGTAVLAFNVVTVEHAEGIAEGVERAGAVALLQVSENTVRFHGGRLAPPLRRAPGSPRSRRPSWRSTSTTSRTSR